MTAEQLLEMALADVDSKSTRAWATSAHNRPIWVQIAAKYLGKPDAAARLTTDIIITAIGL